jgi:hypothetical protein
MNVDGASFLLLVCLVVDVIIVAEVVEYHLSEERLRPRITLRGLLVLMGAVAPQLWLLSVVLRRA